MDQKFTTKSQEALATALRTAGAAGNAMLEPIHLLSALLEDREGIAFEVLSSVADADAIGREVRRELASLPGATGESVAEPQPSQAMLNLSLIHI